MSQYSNINYGNPNATPLSTTVFENVDGTSVSLTGDYWSDNKAYAPLEDCQVSIIPPNSDVEVKKGNLCWASESPYGDSSFGTITTAGGVIGIDEKGTVRIKAASPVAEDLTCGRIEVESQSNTRINVGTCFAINVNTTGQHDEENPVSNSSDQSISEKRYPAFSILVNNGGIDVECADGDIHFSGRNIVMNAAETFTINATKAVNILSGFDATEVFAKAAAGLFGFELPASGGGEINIKGGKFINDCNVSQTTSSQVNEKAGAAKITESGSSMATVSERTSGDKVISTSGNVYIQAGQKMRIEAQGNVVNTTGPAVPPVWGVSQLEALVISANKKSTPKDTAMKIEVDNGDLVQSVSNIGDIGIVTQTGLIGILAGAGNAKSFSGKEGDLVLKSYKGNVLGDAALESSLIGGKISYVAVGKAGQPQDIVGAFTPGFGYGDSDNGVSMKTFKGIASILGKQQVGMGIGSSPGASQNFMAFNPTGIISKANGPFDMNITGATTIKATGAVSFKASGATTIDVTGALTITGKPIKLN
jgi:hypothetical protein